MFTILPIQKIKYRLRALSFLSFLVVLCASGPAASQSSANQPPQVGNDAAVVALGAEVVVDVLANDSGDINPSTVAIFVPQQPELGYLGIDNRTGAITYTPYIGLTGSASDSFGYTVRSSTSVLSDVATVSISIIPELSLIHI